MGVEHETHQVARAQAVLAALPVRVQHQLAALPQRARRDQGGNRRRVPELTELLRGQSVDEEVLVLVDAGRDLGEDRRGPAILQRAQRADEADAHPEVDTAKLIERAQNPRVIGIGETGLDYFYEHSDRANQQASFRAHIAASRETGLPLIVHTRDAEDDTAHIMTEEMENGAYPAVIHCFTASADFARKALELGCYISLSGIVTFKNAKDLQDVAKWLPADRILVETDSPFLAPVPHRGKTGEPAYVSDTAAFVAELRGETIEQLQQQTSDNFYRLFSKAKP